MSLIVREDGSVPLPEDLAQEYGIHKGSRIEWERTSDGALKLRSAEMREAAVRRLRGLGRTWLKPGEEGVEGFLKWRQTERERDDTYGAS